MMAQRRREGGTVAWAMYCRECDFLSITDGPVETCPDCDSPVDRACGVVSPGGGWERLGGKSPESVAAQGERGRERREGEGWRDRFERARDMDINRSIYLDRPSADPRTYRGGTDLPPLIKPRHPVVAFLIRTWRSIAPTDTAGDQP